MTMLTILADRLNQQERLKALKWWTGETGGGVFTDLIWLGLGAIALVAVIFLVSAIASGRTRRAPRDPHKLFRQATIHLGLDLSDRQLLLRIITDRKLEHPVTILMSPRTFDEQTGAWLQALSADEATRKLRHLGDIRKAIFSGSGLRACPARWPKTATNGTSRMRASTTVWVRSCGLLERTAMGTQAFAK
jgi:hypothetical protein